MRKILGELGSKERHTFQANFGKYGYKRYHDMSREICIVQLWLSVM